MTEIPEAPLIDPRGDPHIRVLPDDAPPTTEHDLLGEVVFFVTRVGAWPGVVVAYDDVTKRIQMQVFRKKADGSDLSNPVRHISSGDVPCWAWKHETPIGGIQSAQRPARAHGRFSEGGIRV